MNLILITIVAMILGSFLNMLIYRLPNNEAIVLPPSKCIHCKTVLKPWNLIPIFSYLAQKGKCSSCNTKIPTRYLLVEICNVLCYLWGYLTLGLSLDFYLFAFLSSMLILITFIDIDHMIIPDKLNILLMITGLGWFVIAKPFDLKSLLLGIAIGSGLLLFLAVLTGGFGGGDIKYMFAMSFFLGFKGIVVNMFLGFILGSLIGVILIYTKRKTRKDMIPFGPYLCIGSLVSYLYSGQMIQMYFDYLGY